MGDGGHVQDEIGGAADRGVHDHGVVQRVGGQDRGEGRALVLQVHEREGGAPGHVAPDRGARRAEGGVRQGQAERLAHDLRGRGRAHELAAAARRAAGAATHLGGVVEGDFTLGEAGGEGLDLGGVLAFLGAERGAAGHEDAGQVFRAGQGHHHRGQALVAGGDADDSAAGGQRANEPAEEDRGVVAVGQAVEHRGRAVRAAVAGIAHIAGEGRGAVRRQRAGGLLHEQADFPVPGVVAQRDRRAVGGADAALRAEDEEFLAAQLFWVPAHAGVLRQAEDVAAGGVAQELSGERQLARGPGGGGPQRVDRGIGGIEKGRVIHRLRARLPMDAGHSQESQAAIGDRHAARSSASEPQPGKPDEKNANLRSSANPSKAFYRRKQRRQRRQKLAKISAD